MSTWRIRDGKQAEQARIESLVELKGAFDAHPESEFALLIRSERKVEVDIDPKVIGELQKLLHKAVGDRKGSDY